MSSFLCGADPEVFLVDPHTGLPVSAIGLVGGSKAEPMAVFGSDVGLTVQEDNVTMELGFTPVALDDWGYTVDRVVDEAARLAKGIGLAISPFSELEFPPEMLEAEGARQFGCNPDQLAHEKGRERDPVDARKVGNWRFCGGHLHLGFDKSKALIPDYALVKMLDLALLWSVADGMETASHRRPYYGLPGLFRSKPYGVEYRTPCNAWLKAPRYAYFIFKMGLNCLQKPRAAQKLYKATDWEAVRQSIIQGRDLTNGHVFSVDEILTSAPVEEHFFYERQRDMLAGANGAA